MKIILLTLPYTLASSATGLGQQALALLEKTDIIASTPHTLEALVDPYPGNGKEKLREPQSFISLLQKQLQDEASRDWELSCVLRPWKIPLGEDGVDPLSAAQKHAFPALAVSQSLNPGPKALLPEIYFSVYAEQDIEVSL